MNIDGPTSSSMIANKLRTSDGDYFIYVIRVLRKGGQPIKILCYDNNESTTSAFKPSSVSNQITAINEDRGVTKSVIEE